MSTQKKTYSPKNTDFAGDTAFVADYANHREQTNHLGNVLAVVSDRKIAVEDQGNPGTVEYYEADVVSAQDYYPFGMIMPGRSVSAGEYRFGFNSMEQDDEWSVTGGHMDFGARIYDSRLGRWLSIDPQFKSQPEWSPYKAFNDNPILFVDPDGEREYITINVYDERNDERFPMLMVIDDDKVHTEQFTRSSPRSGAVEKHHAHYDIEHRFNATINKDGEVTYSSEGELHHLRGTNVSGWFGLGDVLSDNGGKDWGDLTQAAGIHIYMGEGGGGVDPTQYTALNEVEMMESGALFAALGAMGKSAQAPNKAMEGIGLLKDFVTTLGGGEDERREGSPTETFICPTCDKPFDASDTADHNERLKREYGPFTLPEDK